MSFYQFWISQQTIPGNVVPDMAIGAATYLVGKYKVGPWLHKRHQEHLDQKERQHQEQLASNRKLYELHKRNHEELLDQHKQLLEQHRQLLEATRAGQRTSTATPSEPAPAVVVSDPSAGPG